MGKNTYDFHEAAHIFKVALDGKFTIQDVRVLVDKGHLKIAPRQDGRVPAQLRLIARQVDSLARMGLDNAEFRRRYLDE